MESKKKHPLSVNGICLGILVTLATLAYMKPGRIINEIFLLVSLSLLIDTIYFFIISRYITIAATDEIVAEKGEQIEVKFIVNNTAYLPSPFIYIQSKESIRLELKGERYLGILLGAEEQMNQSIIYEAQFSGIEKVGFQQIVIKSFMGMIKKKIEVAESVTVRILPEIRELGHIKYFCDFLKGMNSKGQGGREDQALLGSEIGYELRPYVEGDSQKLIHWKLAAYKDEYFVRELEGEQIYRNKLVFILNPFMDEVNRQGEIRKQDKMVTTYISLIAYYLNRGEKIKAVYYKENEWKSMELGLPSQLRQLQENLCDYSGIALEDTVEKKKIIRAVLHHTKVKQGIRILVSGCWKQEIEDYLLNSGVSTQNLSVVWWESQFPESQLGQSAFSFWHMTDEYELIFKQQKIRGE